jgi:EAL domain-containing protein (putative c-di-GMP-specific phosphodiesterase class I)
MRFDQDSPWLVGIAICACAALGIAAYGLGSGQFSVPLLAFAIIALGFAQVVMQIRQFFRNAALDGLAQDQRMMARRLDAAEHAARDWQFGHEELQRNLAELRSGFSAELKQSQDFLAQGLEDMRQGHAAIAGQIRGLMEKPQVAAPVVEPQFPQHLPQAQVPPSMNQTAAADNGRTQEVPFGERLTLALEPVIDLYTMQTAHYRMIVSMRNDRGQDVAPEFFLHHAAQTGQRAALDQFVVGEALSVLARLRERDPNLCLLTSVGAATLAEPQALRAILAAMMDYGAVSQGLVIEISHAVLASLPDASLEGLATLARAGVTLALANAAISGVDLAALGKLNVRYVSLAAASLEQGERSAIALGGFVQAARALRIQVIITQVSDPARAQDLTRQARYASGPAFAPPRRLKRVEDNASLASAA